jgi:drug/metabolite transporter (DMT)-like permease
MTVTGDPGARRQVTGLARVLAAAALMGTLGPVAAVAYGEGVGPATFSALRAAIGAALLGALVVSRRQPSVRLGTLAPRERALLVLAIGVNGLMNLVLFFAFGAMSVGLVMVIFYSYPVLVALMSAALGRERLTPRKVGALALALAGLAMVLGSQLGPDAHATAAGVALAGVAATCHAVYLVAIRGGFDRVPSVQATSLVLVGGLVISGTAAFLLEGAGALTEWPASPVAWAAVLCAGTLGAVPKAWIMGGVRIIGSMRAAMALLVEPVVAVTVAALALGQRLTVTELVGGAAILAAVVLVQRPAATRSAPRSPVDPRGGPPAPSG